MRGAIVLILAITALIAIGRNAKAAEGIASWYGYESGTKTASGRKFNPEEMTCAMRRRDWGTVLTVTVIATGATATCTLTDFGPAKWTGRLIDVSLGMARKLGFHKRGLARVRVH